MPIIGVKIVHFGKIDKKNSIICQVSTKEKIEKSIIRMKKENIYSLTKR